MDCCCPPSRPKAAIDPALLKLALSTAHKHSKLQTAKIRGVFQGRLDLTSAKLLVADRVGALLADHPAIQRVWRFARPVAYLVESILPEGHCRPVELENLNGDFSLWMVEGKFVISDHQGVGIVVP